jgi:hypothetical protein
MRNGRREGPVPTLDGARRRCAQDLAMLPAAVRNGPTVASYPVRISAAVQALAEEVDRRSQQPWPQPVDC